MKITAKYKNTAQEHVIMNNTAITGITDRRTQELLPVYMFSAGKGHNQEYRDRTNDSPCYHFLYIENGEGVFEFPDATYTLEKGNIVFFRKGCPVIYRPKKNHFITAWVAFDGKLVKELLEYYRAGGYSFLKSESVWLIMQGIYKLASAGASPDVLSTRVYELIVTYFNELNKTNVNDLLEKAKVYIDNNFAQNISIADIAAAVGVSESLIFKLFREKEKSTPVDYLRNIRIENAKRMLIENDGLKILDIAVRCGFSESAYFCSVFRKYTGMTPRSYWKMYRSAGI